MNWEVWNRIERLLIERAIKPIVAVVPDNRDPGLVAGGAREDFWERVREWQQRGWTIAMHGYQHVYQTRDSGLVGLNDYSEFAGLPVEAQRKKLRSAAEIFKSHGVRPSLWVAPGHSFDGNTITALREIGIDAISDGFHFRIVERLGCRWIPQQLWRFRTMPFGIWTVCLHPNTMSASQLAEFERALDRLSPKIVACEDLLRAANRVAEYSVVDVTFQWLWRCLLHFKRLA